MRSEKMSDKYILKGRTPVKAESLEEWAIAFERGDSRRVAQDEPAEGIRVSTVFLGIDHSWGDGPPLLFETMIFGGPQDDYQERYSTWEQAEAGHARAILAVLSSTPSQPEGTKGDGG